MSQGEGYETLYRDTACVSLHAVCTYWFVKDYWDIGD